MNQVIELTDILDIMGALELFSMRSAFDEIVTTAVKRQHDDLLKAEIDEKQGRIHQVPDDHRQAAARKGRR